MSTHTDPRCQYLIDLEISKLGWMENGPRKDQAKHMIKTRILSMPWKDMLDLYAKTKWSEDHGRIRVIQYYEVADSGHSRNTRMVIKQNIHGTWAPVQVIYVDEEDA